ncbi:MAG: hypothetical protein ACR2PZ_21510 [Pseudomonadales bacterium]
MSPAKDAAQVRSVHDQYLQALGAGDMDTVAELFTFPAAFKGFLDDVILATDKASLLAAYEQLIAVAPTATRMELLDVEVNYIRPQVYELAMIYEQYGAEDALIHSGRAVYFMKPVDGAFKIFAVF